jgi:hypothetical protein
MSDLTGVDVLGTVRCARRTPSRAMRWRTRAQKWHSCCSAAKTGESRSDRRWHFFVASTASECSENLLATLRFSSTLGHVQPDPGHPRERPRRSGRRRQPRKAWSVIYQQPWLLTRPQSKTVLPGPGPGRASEKARCGQRREGLVWPRMPDYRGESADAIAEFFHIGISTVINLAGIALELAKPVRGPRGRCAFFHYKVLSEHGEPPLY